MRKDGNQSVLWIGSVAIAAAAASAQPTFETMTPPQGSSAAHVADLSGDGGMIVGTLSSNLAFVWSGSAVSTLGLAAGMTSNQAVAISRDGRTVLARGSPGGLYLWRSVGDPVLLSSFQDATVLATTTGMSPDGQILFGVFSNISPERAWTWTESGGIRWLADLPVGTLGSQPREVSSDGLTVIGRGSTLTDLPVVRWAGGQAPVAIAEDRFWGAPVAVSTDGSIVAANHMGQGYLVQNNQRQRLNTPAPHIPGTTITSMSDDGQRAAGEFRYNIPPVHPNGTALIWDAVNGSRHVADVLQNAGITIGNWFLQSAIISGDGSTLAGIASSTVPPQAFRAYRVRLPVTACHANCDQSNQFPALNAKDFQCFLDNFVAGNSSANCDGSTTPPILNANDFLCFLNAFNAGCP